MEQHPLFSSRDTLDEAVVYGVELLAFLSKMRKSRG